MYNRKLSTGASSPESLPEHGYSNMIRSGQEKPENNQRDKHTRRYFQPIASDRNRFQPDFRVCLAIA